MSQETVAAQDMITYRQRSAKRPLKPFLLKERGKHTTTSEIDVFIRHKRSRRDILLSKLRALS